MDWLQDILYIAIKFSIHENFVRKVMAALEASWVLNHVNPSFLLISLQKRVYYAICNKETDLLNIVLRNGKKTFRLLEYVSKIQKTP